MLGQFCLHRTILIFTNFGFDYDFLYEYMTQIKWNLEPYYNSNYDLTIIFSIYTINHFK